MERAGEHSLKLSEAVLRKYPAAGRYLVGVSGGRDSVALLHWLHAHRFKKLIVCHLDHQLRGRASRADAKFVERLAQKLGYDSILAVADVKTLARKSHRSLETAGRAARLRFFGQVARRRRCDAIFLGHHADDLVETFLINLLRGAGVGGLGGIREIARQKIEGRDLTLVRPLLGVWRREIDEYVATQRLKFREDISNAELTPLRNRVRRRVLPYLEKTFGRNVRSSIWRAAAIFAEENAWLDQLIDENLIADVELSVAKLRVQPLGAQRRLLQKWLRQNGIAEVGYEVVERVRALLEPGTSVAKTNLPRGQHARRRAGKLFID